MNAELSEEQRELSLLALALCSLLRPGFLDACQEIAEHSLSGGEMFDNFRKCNLDTIKPQCQG